MLGSHLGEEEINSLLLGKGAGPTMGLITSAPAILQAELRNFRMGQKAQQGVRDMIAKADSVFSLVWLATYLQGFNWWSILDRLTEILETEPDDSKM